MILKKILPVFIMIMMIAAVSGVDILTEPYTDSFSVESETGVTVQTVNSALGVDSCHVDTNWETESCDYIYWCYAILPSNSDDISDALLKECVDATVAGNTNLRDSLSVNQFVPPKGVLYYVTTFFTVVHYNFNQITDAWVPIPSIPQSLPDGTQIINAKDIRSVCPDTQMLGQERDVAGVIIGPKCYIAERVCLDPLNTGLCTNPFPLFVLDKDENGAWEDNVGDPSNYCRDQNRDRICDVTVDLECPDTCSLFEVDGAGGFVCSTPGANGLCDEWDMAGLFSCVDRELSPNSNICDSKDIVGCLRDYNPVCVDTGTDEITFPNSCFAEGQGFASWTLGACIPPITQCFNPNDCPDADVCLGGSTAGITKLCLANMCSYSGACSTVQCQQTSDCENLDMPCVGVFPTCSNSVCTINGNCLTKPEAPGFNLFDLIASVWNAFWNFVRGLFT